MKNEDGSVDMRAYKARWKSWNKNVLGKCDKNKEGK